MSTPRVSDLVGAWTLERWVIAYEDGRPDTHPYGADALGQILYTADGHMSATVSRAHRPPLSAAAVRKAPEAEKAAAFESFFHYAGRYELVGDEVHHHVLVALDPGFAGSTQARRAELEGDLLTLSAEERAGGVGRTHRLLWRRVASEPSGD